MGASCARLSLLYFYPRPPRGERPKMVCARLRGLTFLSTPSARRATLPRLSRASIWAFLSTPSARRATSLILMPLSFIAYFYPRPPRGGRRHRQGSGSGTGRISIHALREEGDQSTWKPVLSLPISIHALREEGDCKNGEKHLRFCFIIKRSAQIWKSFSKNIRKKSRDLHRTA